MKHFLWHGNVDAALKRLDSLMLELELQRKSSTAVAKVLRSATEFDIHIRNN